MNVFVSHSMEDRNLTEMVRSLLRRNGVTPLIAEDDVSISETVAQKVERYIGQSHLALILLTKNGNASRFVHQEIGYLESQKKPTLLLVEKGLEKEISGFLYGRDFVTVDPKDVEAGLRKVEEKVVGFLRKWWKGIAVVVAVILLVLVWVFSQE